MPKTNRIDPSVPARSGRPDDAGIVDLGERDLAPPGYKRRELPRWVGRLPGSGPRIRATVAAIAVAAVVGGVVLGFVRLPAIGGDTAPTRSLAAPTAAPTVRPTPVPVVVAATPTPVLAHGWPVDLPAGSGGDPVKLGPVGPDGTIYVTGAVPIDEHGNGRLDWLRLPDGTYLSPQFFGPDGSAYGYAFDVDGYATIWAFGPDGRARYAYSTNGGVVPAFGVSKAGLLYTLTPSPWANPVPAGVYRVVVLGLDGSPRAAWPAGEAWASTFLLRPNGSVLVGQSDAQGCGLHAYSPGGVDLTAEPDPCWGRMAVGPDGTVVGWSYEAVAGVGTAIVSTTIALLGTDGGPAPGWPKVIPGIASSPAFGEAGSIYVVVSRGPVASAVLERLDASAANSWTLPLGGEPLVAASPAAGGQTVPEPPVVGGGMVFVAESKDVAAFDVTGVAAPGWPYRLPAGWSIQTCTTDGGASAQVDGAAAPVAWSPDPATGPGSGEGRLYLALEDRVVALTSAGAVAPGWPYAAGVSGCWYDPKATPDGGVAMLGLQAGSQDLVVLRLTIDGKLPD
jgi:hypothetical protein